MPGDSLQSVAEVWSAPTTRVYSGIAKSWKAADFFPIVTVLNRIIQIGPRPAAYFQAFHHFRQKRAKGCPRLESACGR